MSPEQATAERTIDGRADIYALGCVLYEMLTGHPPFVEATVRETLARHSIEPVPTIREIRPDVPEFVDQAVGKALAKAPGDRFASASDFRAALARVDVRPPKVNAARRWLVFAGACVAVLLAALAVSWRSQSGVEGRAPTTADAPPSIAILPFTNVGGLAVNEPFSDGIADELTTALGKFDGVNVLARSSAFSVKAKGLSAREIGRRLHVRYILEGSVRSSAQPWRVNAALMDTTTGTEVWSDSFDLDPLNRDLFTVTDSITRSIVRLLVPHISGAAIASSVRRPTENPAAHELYMQGRYFFEKRDSLGLAKAQAYFERAIETDSMYALAYAGLSDAYGQQSVFGSPARVGFPKAKVYARRALSLDTTLVEAHTSLGFIALFYDWDLPVAGRELATALRLDPRYPPAHLFHAWYYMAADSVNEGIDAGRRAVQLDPFSSIINTRLVTFLFYGRRYGEALDQANKIIERDSTFVQVRLERAWVYVQLGRCADAMADLARAPDQQLRGVRGYVYAKCGHRAEALGELDVLRRQAAEGKYVSPYWRAVIQGGLGNTDQALAELERAHTERSWTMFMIRLEPAFQHLHGDARFERLVRRVGLTRGSRR